MSHATPSAAPGAAAALLGLLLAAGSLALLPLPAMAQSRAQSPAPTVSGCDPQDRIDRSTAADARQKFERAGFTSVRELHKGCDNFWHGRATKDGWDSNVALSPQGEVMREGD